MYRMTDEEFEAAMEEALDAMPEQFLDALQNIAIVWEEEPNAYHLYGDDPEAESGSDSGDFNDPENESWGNSGTFGDPEAESWGGNGDSGAQSQSDATLGDAEAPDDFDDALPDDLLGLFDGLSIVERANGLDDDIPDVITVFKGPHERCFSSREEIVTEIGKTIIHELGHYFGLEDDKLYDMGY
ncbi:metallopeptidase family protein [Adlercreutzia equolifaciens]|uniref:metallopeptidase family protein n=1 Tax=Adlercreutzia equolifaciens TaxID=446660 RepID=UPI0023AFEDD1|nr:metallopeptidase family protein [Adlercreutzia equolifaciens]MDE8701396.1 metallopeptidase family protein [Adlercreutzia equolifaciens]